METHIKTPIGLKNITYDEQGYPIFGKGILKEMNVCIRPGHKSSITQIHAEKKDGKIISHNYGHAGVGWSILFGSVEKSIENFENLREENKIDYNEEITVIGLGCIGLVTALTLYHKGYKNIKIIGEKFLNTPSFGAGGLIEFSLSTIYKTENIEFMNKLFEFTVNTYKSIANGTHKFIKGGVKEVDYYTDFYQEHAGLHYLTEIGMFPKLKKVILQIGDNEATKRELYHFKTYHVSTYVTMNEMLETCKKLGIQVEHKKLSTFNEVDSRVVFNCSGLGSKDLNKDANMYPICGHGIVLNDNSISNHDYIIRLTNVPELKDHPADGSVYFMPKTSGFIGGTYLKNYDGSDDKYNKELVKNLLIRARLLFEGIKPQINPKF
jgi:hypothetical protein